MGRRAKLVDERVSELLPPPVTVAVVLGVEREDVFRGMGNAKSAVVGGGRDEVFRGTVRDMMF